MSIEILMSNEMNTNDLKVYDKKYNEELNECRVIKGVIADMNDDWQNAEILINETDIKEVKDELIIILLKEMLWMI
jgi:hypothetical protein